MYALSIRHLYLIKSSFPRILDLVYWPTIQIILWGFVSKFFSIHTDYYNNTIGVILTCAILYDILFRSSISFNILFLEEIWSRNFTNLFIAPLRISEIIISLVLTALLRTLIGLVPAILITSPLFGISILDLGTPLFLLAPLGCIYYPIEILPEFFQTVAKLLPLVYIFEEARSILVNNTVNYSNIMSAIYLNIFYLFLGISLFYYSFNKARDKGTLINVGE